MKHVARRIASGPDGRTVADPIDIDLKDLPIGTGMHAHEFGQFNVALSCFPAGFERGMHTSELPAWALVMSGSFEVLLGEDRSHVFGPGELVLFDDLSGEGHGVRVSGEDVWVFTAGASPEHVGASGAADEAAE